MYSIQFCIKQNYKLASTCHSLKISIYCNKNMKRSYQLMQIYDIEKDFGRHKQKLKSIQQINTHKKISQLTKNPESLSAYKNSHSIANSFLLKQTKRKIKKENDLLYNNLVKQNNRKPYMTMRKDSHSDSSKSLMRNTSLTIKTSRIKQENSKIQKKLQATKSTFEKFKKSNSSLSLSKKKDRPQQQLKRFLENQFRIKPTVLFPQVRRAKQIQKSKLSQDEIRRGLPKFYEQQITKTLNSKRDNRKINKYQSTIKR